MFWCEYKNKPSLVKLRKPGGWVWEGAQGLSCRQHSSFFCIQGIYAPLFAAMQKKHDLLMFSIKFPEFLFEFPGNETTQIAKQPHVSFHSSGCKVAWCFVEVTWLVSKHSCKEKVSVTNEPVARASNEISLFKSWWEEEYVREKEGTLWSAYVLIHQRCSGILSEMHQFIAEIQQPVLSGWLMVVFKLPALKCPNSLGLLCWNPEFCFWEMPGGASSGLIWLDILKVISFLSPTILPLSNSITKIFSSLRSSPQGYFGLS